MDKNILNIISYNCNSGSIHKRDYMKMLINEIQPQFLCVQETWYLSHETKDKLKLIHDDYVPHGVSGVDDRIDVLKGRPYGGCGILWHKSLTHNICELSCDNNRMCAVSFKMVNGRTLLLICCYMPNDNMSVSEVNIEFVDICMDLEALICINDHDDIVIAGDWNTDFNRNTAQTRYLRQFMETINVKCSFDHINSIKEDTFYSFNNNGSSCIDYFMLSEELYNNVFTSNVVWEGINLSPHQPVSVCLDVAYTCEDVMVEKSTFIPKHSWCKASHEDIELYKDKIDMFLADVMIPEDVLNCDIKGCNNSDHLQCIDYLFDCIIETCVNASHESIPFCKESKGIPKWNEMAQPARERALFWHKMWLQCGKPKHGVVHDLRVKTRREYHKVVKGLKRDEDINRSEKMAEAIVNSNTRSFWSEAKRVKQSSKTLPDSMDGVRGSSQIANLFGQKYKTLFNSVPTDNDLMQNVVDEVDTKLMSLAPLDASCIVTFDDFKKALSMIKNGKSDGSSQMDSDHLINASDKLLHILSEIIGLCFKHAYVSPCINIANIVPIPKDKKGSLVKGDNYRGIGLCSSIMKIFDIIIINKSGLSLNTSDLQFAYKADHSTTMSTLLLKDIVKYYNRNGSAVYACFLDASKAFDRVRIDKLFMTLLKRGFPVMFIKFLMNAYNNQQIKVKWGSDTSDCFKGINGIRQGGVLSPILFTVYIDALVDELKGSNAGCFIGHMFVGCLIYADDIVLLCPSVMGLQKMVDVCSDFGFIYDILFNDKKSLCVNFSNDTVNPDIRLNGKSLVWEKKTKHVGNVVNCTLSDEDDIFVKRQDFFQQVNKLLCDYKGIRRDIVIELFVKFCTSYYGCQSWDLRSCHLKSFLTGWNKAARRVLALPYDSHRYLLPVLLGVESLMCVLKKRFIKLCITMDKTSNETVSFLYRYFKYDPSSIIARNLYFVCMQSEIDNLNDLCKLYSLIKSDELNDVQVGNIMLLKELLEIRDGIYNLEGFDRDHVEIMIENVSRM